MKNGLAPSTVFAVLLAGGGTACHAERELPVLDQSSHLYARGLRKAALGCYRLDPYGVTDPRWRDRLMQHLAVYRLGKDTVLGPASGRRVVTGMHRTATDSSRGLGFDWTADSLTDSVEVGGGDGFTGFTIRVAPGATAWGGRAEYWEDVGPPFEHDLGPVRAYVISCAETSSVAPPANDR